MQWPWYLSMIQHPVSEGPVISNHTSFVYASMARETLSAVFQCSSCWRTSETISTTSARARTCSGSSRTPSHKTAMLTSIYVIKPHQFTINARPSYKRM